MSHKTLHQFFNKLVNASEKSTEFYCGDFTRGYFVVAISAVGGTNATLKPIFRGSIGDGQWYHLLTIIDPYTQGDLTRTGPPTWEDKLTVPGVFYGEIERLNCEYIRCDLEVGGTNPAFNISVTGVFE